MAISAVTGLDIILSIVLMGVLTTLYTSFGGFEAVIWTDVMQGLMMLVGLGLISWTAISALPNGTEDFININASYERFNYMISSFNLAQPIIYFLSHNQLSIQWPLYLIRRKLNAFFVHPKKIWLNSLAYQLLAT